MHLDCPYTFMVHGVNPVERLETGRSYARTFPTGSVPTSETPLNEYRTDVCALFFRVLIFLRYSWRTLQARLFAPALLWL